MHIHTQHRPTLDRAECFKIRAAHLTSGTYSITVKFQQASNGKCRSPSSPKSTNVLIYDIITLYIILYAFQGNHFPLIGQNNTGSSYHISVRHMIDHLNAYTLLCVNKTLLFDCAVT